MPTRIKPARRITARYRCNHCGQIVGVLRQPLSSWNAGVRVHRMFDKLGLVTVEDLIQKTPWELLAVPGFGCMNLILVRERLSRLGLSLRRSNCK